MSRKSNVVWATPPISHAQRESNLAQYGYTNRAWGTSRSLTIGASGKRECDRRRRQIERGQLRAENGLA